MDCENLYARIYDETMVKGTESVKIDKTSKIEFIA